MKILIQGLIGSGKSTKIQEILNQNRISYEHVVLVKPSTDLSSLKDFKTYIVDTKEFNKESFDLVMSKLNTENIIVEDSLNLKMNIKQNEYSEVKLIGKDPFSTPYEIFYKAFEFSFKNDIKEGYKVFDNEDRLNIFISKFSENLDNADCARAYHMLKDNGTQRDNLFIELAQRFENEKPKVIHEVYVNWIEKFYKK